MLKTYLREKGTLIDKTLSELMANKKGNLACIHDAMQYSLFAGGKRLRPVLLMAAADAVGGNGTKYLPVACALEMIHTYSLIHDDLPAMDNDDYRRGKLTNHKVYGEGLAILAGDALLTDAFAVMLSQPDVQPAILLKVVHEIAEAAGSAGMVGGQAIDLASEDTYIDANTLRLMHQAKTGALFRAALRGGAMLAGASDQAVESLTEYAEQFGLAFQITDDILDVTGSEDKIGKPVGSDIRNHKSTYVSLYSLDGARKMAQQAVSSALISLEPFGEGAAFLREMVKFLLIREN